MSLFNLGFAVQAMGTEVVYVVHYARDTYDSHGVALPRVASGAALTPRCSVQPTTGSELKLLPEALRTSNIKSIWSPIDLAEGDLVTCTAGVFKVFKVIDWAAAGAYCKAIMIQLDESEGD